MSTDFDAICGTCGQFHHLGILGGTYQVFGYSTDDEVGRTDAANFIGEHLGCGRLLIVHSQYVPSGYTNAEGSPERTADLRFEVS